jgi:ribosomal-protein-alanine N-acetyltransferase
MIKNNEAFLLGTTIKLRNLMKTDLDGDYVWWLNDQEVVKFNSHGRFPVSKNEIFDYIENSTRNQSQIILAIIDIKSNKHIGNISLQKINWVDRSAEIAFLLGDREFHGKGIMFEAGTLLINHAFISLNLHRVYCGTSSENIAMQKLAIKLGMIQEGVRKKAIFNNGSYHDIIEYGLLNI